MSEPDGTYAGIAALAEPARRALYDCVAASATSVSREQAAEAVGVPVHTAKFHLDRLVADGLLEVEFRRLSGRTGPGAGRPAKLYRRSPREFAVSLPPRHYDLAGEILAEAIGRATDGLPLPAALSEAARHKGFTVAHEHPGNDADALLSTLAGLGYEPRQESTGLRLVNCPFHALAQQHTALVCGVNRDFVQGLLDAMGRDDVSACLTPTPGQCCVTVSAAVDVESDDLPG